MTIVAEYLKKYKMGPKKRKEKYQKDHYEIIRNYVPDLLYEDFIQSNITKEQLQMIPAYYATQIKDWVEASGCEQDYLLMQNQAVDILKGYIPDITLLNIKDYIDSGKLDFYELIYAELEEKKKEYDDFCKKYLSDLEQYVEKQRKYYSEIQKKYYLEFVHEYENLLSAEDLKKFEETAVKKDSFFYGIKGLSIFFGSNLGYSRLIDYFQKEYEEQLSDLDVSNYRKETIKESRIEYFRYYGIDFGNNYDLYVNNPECQKIWPSEDLINKIINSSLEYEEKANIEYSFNIPFYKEILERISKCGLLDKEEVFTPDIFNRKITCVMPNIVEKENEYALYSQAIFCVTDDDYLDKNIIHELNHLYELALVSTSNKKYECICGWDVISGKFNQDDNLTTLGQVEYEKREYELFNEIINELIAQKIAVLMHKKGIYFFCDKDNCKDFGGTSYERNKLLVKDFFDEYYEEIIESRKNNNIHIIWDKVGKENFESLNRLIQEFNKLFPEFTFYHLVDDLNNNVDSELTRSWESIKTKKDIILNNMREYSRKTGIFNG